MTPKQAFKIYFGINRHFGSLDYSMLKYGVNTKAAESKYDSMSQEQKFRFEWLSTKFVQTQDLVYACIGSQFDSINMQYGMKEDVLQSYYKFKARRESMTYTLSSDEHKHELSGFLPLNKLIYKYLIGDYSPEYILLITHENENLFDLYNSPNLAWAKDSIMKLIKYKDFFNSQKYLNLVADQNIYSSRSAIDA